MPIIKDFSGGGPIERVPLSEVPEGGIFFLIASTRSEKTWMKTKVKDTRLLANPDVVFCVAVQSGDGDMFPNSLNVEYIPNAAVVLNSAGKDQ